MRPLAVYGFVQSRSVSAISILAVAILNGVMCYVLGLGGVPRRELGRPEGASNIALASFSFPSLAAYEDYRTKSFNDPDIPFVSYP